LTIAHRFSLFGTFVEQRWRDPDLQEVIEYLTHTSDVIKENAAAYLQHLCYNDDNIKSKTRSLNGIAYLVTLLQHEKPEIQKNACGALRNLCYGKRNDENKVRPISILGSKMDFVVLLSD
jgi:catenin delta-2